MILHNLEKFLAGRTVVMMAHRLSIVRYADNIVVMQQGPGGRAKLTHRTSSPQGVILRPRKKPTRTGRLTRGRGGDAAAWL